MWSILKAKYTVQAVQLFQKYNINKMHSFFFHATPTAWGCHIAHCSPSLVTTCCEMYSGDWCFIFSTSHLGGKTDILRSAICTGAKNCPGALPDVYGLISSYFLSSSDWGDGLGQVTVHFHKNKYSIQIQRLYNLSLWGMYSRSSPCEILKVSQADLKMTNIFLYMA